MNEQRVKLLKESIVSDPKDPFNYYGLAMEYLDSDMQQSMIILTKLQSTHPNYLPTYYQLGTLLHDLDLSEKAKEVIMQGIKVSTDQNEAKTKKELEAALQNILFEE